MLSASSASPKNLKPLPSLLLLLAVCFISPPLIARQRFHDQVLYGNRSSIADLTGTPLRVFGSYSGADVTVYLQGTSTLATIYADAAGTAKANPFKADSRSFVDFFHDVAVTVTYTNGGLPSSYSVYADIGAAGGDVNTISAAAAPYSMVCDGTTDIATAWAAVIAAAGAVSAPTTIVLPNGVCATSTKLIIPSTSRPINIRGSRHHGAVSATEGTILKATAGMTAVLSVEAKSILLQDLMVDANLLSTDGIYFLNATSAQLDGVWETGALRDGGHSALTGINQGMNIRNSTFTVNGSTYMTAAIASQFDGGARRTIVAGSAATTSGNATITITGFDPTTISPAVRKGDLIWVGATPATAFFGQISSVSSTTVVLQGNSSNLPTTTGSGLDFAIGVGDAWHYEPQGANGSNYIENSYFRSSGGCGIRIQSLYGDSINHGYADYNNMCGISAGVVDNVGATRELKLDHVYMEFQPVDYVIGNVINIKIDLPTDSSTFGAVFMVNGLIASGTVGRGDTFESISLGAWQNFIIQVRNNAGTRQHRIVGDFIQSQATNTATRITGFSATYATLPTVDAVTAFTSGAGVLSGVPTVLMLDTAAAQNVRVSGSCVVESNSTGTPYTCTLSTTSQNVNGTTRVRPVVYLINAAGANVNWDTAVIGAGTNIAVRVSMYIR